MNVTSVFPCLVLLMAAGGVGAVEVRSLAGMANRNLLSLTPGQQGCYAT